MNVRCSICGVGPERQHTFWLRYGILANRERTCSDCERWAVRIAGMRVYG